METIHIALASNQNYVIGLEVTAGSIAYHASKEVKLVFHVLDGGIKDDTFGEMAEKIKKLHPLVEFHLLAVDENLFSNFPTWVGNRMAYARFLLPDVLPDVSHIIYSDVDFLWLIDIAELWRQRTADDIIMGVLDDSNTIEKEKIWFKSHNLPFDCSRYFCSGMSIYNLNKFREEGTVRKLFEFLEQYPDVKFPDQAALNYVFRNRVTLLPSKWQSFSTALTAENIQHPLAIHYAGDAPWRRDQFWAIPISDSTLLWYAMYDYIEGVRPGTSIKSHLNRWQRFYKRSLAIIYRCSATRRLFNCLLKATGRGAYIGNFNKFARNLGLSNKSVTYRVTKL